MISLTWIEVLVLVCLLVTAVTSTVYAFLSNGILEEGGRPIPIKDIVREGEMIYVLQFVTLCDGARGKFALIHLLNRPTRLNHNDMMPLVAVHIGEMPVRGMDRIKEEKGPFQLRTNPENGEVELVEDSLARHLNDDGKTTRISC